MDGIPEYVRPMLQRLGASAAVEGAALVAVDIPHVAESPACLAQLAPCLSVVKACATLFADGERGAPGGDCC